MVPSRCHRHIFAFLSASALKYVQFCLRLKEYSLEFRIDILQVPLEGFTVQLPTLLYSVCNTGRNACCYERERKRFHDIRVGKLWIKSCTFRAGVKKVIQLWRVSSPASLLFLHFVFLFFFLWATATIKPTLPEGLSVEPLCCIMEQDQVCLSFCTYHQGD